MKIKKRYKIKKLALLLSVVGLGLVLLLCFLPKRYHFFMSVGFTSSDTPYVEVAIDGNKYSMGVDLGSKFQMSMTPEALEGIEKLSDGTGSWVNIRGERHEYPQYQISKVGMGPLVFKDVMTVEKPLSTECVLWSHSNESMKLREPDGDLGKNFLQKMNLLLDLGAARIVVSNNLQKLKLDGYDLEQFQKLPIEITDKLILIEVNTELGSLKLVFDTGATITAIRSSLLDGEECDTNRNGFPCKTLGSFVMEGHDFGEQEAYILDITEEITSAGIDGIIGMDFIKKHIVYLDFPKKMAYVKAR